MNTEQNKAPAAIAAMRRYVAGANRCASAGK